MNQNFLGVCDHWDEKLKANNKDLKEMDAQISSEVGHFGGSAFISFETEHDKEAVLHSVKKSFWLTFFEAIFLGSHHSKKKTLIFKEHEIHISLASEPTDVLWENLTLTYTRQLQRRYVSFFIFLLFIIGCAVVLIMLTRIQ